MELEGSLPMLQYWKVSYVNQVTSLSLRGIVLISTWACKLITNALTGCSVNFDHIFDLINTFQMQLPVFHSLLEESGAKLYI